jgi:hypothetical protein
MSARHTTETPWAHVLSATLGLTLLLAVLVTAFAWPAANTEPHEVPLAVAAPPTVGGQVEQALADAVGEDAFAVIRVADRAAAVAAIEDREVYGGLVLSPQGAEMLIASAASPAVAQVLGQLAARLPVDFGGPAPVTDVVPLPEDDPRGAGLAAGSLPLVLAGVAAAAVLSLRVRGTAQLLAGAVGFALAVGLVMTAVLQLWLGSLAGDYWATSAVGALAVGAVATTALGLARLLGTAGLGLAAAVMVLLGNPLSGLASAPELLPAGWGALGQLLPPGAAGTALRSVAFFDGAGMSDALVVLGCWLGVGLLLCVVPLRTRQRVQVAEPVAA